MTILDSNVWIAYFHKYDSQNIRAQKIVEEVRDTIVITEYIVLEICTALAAKAGKKIANAFLKIISDNSNVDILLSDKHFFEEVTHLFQKNKLEKLSFIDVSLLYLSHAAKIVTFDKYLQKALK